MQFLYQKARTEAEHHVSLVFTERILSYAKIVQMSAKQKKTPQDLLLLCRMQPILFKDSASESKAKENSAGFAFALPNAAYLI